MNERLTLSLSYTYIHQRNVQVVNISNEMKKEIWRAWKYDRPLYETQKNKPEFGSVSHGVGRTQLP